MATLNSYLTFNGNCREAMKYYHGIFGGELEMMVVKDTPVASQMPPKYENQILHSSLKTEKFELMATDMVPGQYIEGNTVHQCLVCSSEEELNDLFQKLSEGGIVKQPISQMFFGLIANLTDKFGKHWIVEFDKPARPE